MIQEQNIAQQQPPDEAALPIPVQLDPKYMTPVFSTAQPSSGVPAQLRKRAYSLPAYDTRRWMLLLAADRAEAGGSIARDAVVPGRQKMLLRHYVRLARAHPEGVAAYGAAILSVVGLRAIRRRRSR